MSYVTPITDRAQSDITNKTSKGYWNVADWSRVYGNSRLVNGLTAIELGALVYFDTLIMPTIITIPTVAEFNMFLANIERVRVAVSGESISGTTTEIKDDYIAGPGQDAPDFSDANLWESTLDAIWDYYDGASLNICPTLNNDLTILTGTQYVVVDCLDLATYNVDIQGTGVLIIL
jgi:hypothetical protein